MTKFNNFPILPTVLSIISVLIAVIIIKSILSFVISNIFPIIGITIIIGGLTVFFLWQK